MAVCAQMERLEREMEEAEQHARELEEQARRARGAWGVVYKAPS